MLRMLQHRTYINKSLVIASIFLPACLNTTITTENSMKLTSKSYSDNSFIPVRYTRYGDNVSPHFSWTNIPAKTQSLALIIDDPDAPKRTFTHLVVFNITTDHNHQQENHIDI
jgi:phosphatidylethanolamine-binding protein (PEBP) family uncharacterized protein